MTRDDGEIGEQTADDGQAPDNGPAQEPSSQSHGPDAQAEAGAEAKSGDAPDDGLTDAEWEASDNHPTDALIVDVGGFEGPLDVLLTLAKAQKVDLAKISVLALAEQYLYFIAEAKKKRLELAAEYLVMAAWLAYLKSKLLLPDPEDEDEEPTGEELAAQLQFHLQRLEAMREAAAKLMARDRLGRDVFPRGDPEPVRVHRLADYRDTLQDLLKAYTRQRTRTIEITYEPTRPPIYAIEQARHRIESMLGKIADWSMLEMFLPGTIEGVEDGPRKNRTAVASTFTATLELVRDGFLEIRQLKQFGPLYVRRRRESGENEPHWQDPPGNGDAGSGDAGSGDLGPGGADPDGEGMSPEEAGPGHQDGPGSEEPVADACPPREDAGQTDGSGEPDTGPEDATGNGPFGTTALAQETLEGDGGDEPGGQMIPFPGNPRAASGEA